LNPSQGGLFLGEATSPGGQDQPTKKTRIPLPFRENLLFEPGENIREVPRAGGSIYAPMSLMCPVRASRNNSTPPQGTGESCKGSDAGWREPDKRSWKDTKLMGDPHGVRIRPEVLKEGDQSALNPLIKREEPRPPGGVWRAEKKAGNSPPAVKSAPAGLVDQGRERDAPIRELEEEVGRGRRRSSVRVEVNNQPVRGKHPLP